MMVKGKSNIGIVKVVRDWHNDAVPFLFCGSSERGFALFAAARLILHISYYLAGSECACGCVESALRACL